MTGLYKCFKRQSLPNSNNTGLGDALTKEANATVQRVTEEGTTLKGRKRNFTPEQKGQDCECGNTAAARHFSKDFPTLGEITVRVFKKQY